MLSSTLHESIYSKEPFSSLSKENIDSLLEGARIVAFSPGERLLRPDELNSCVFYILEGVVRHLTPISSDNGPSTIQKSAEGSLIGWISLARAQPTEFVQASTNVKALAIDSKLFVEHFLKSSSNPIHPFFFKAQPSEVHYLLNAYEQQSTRRFVRPSDEIVNNLHLSAKVILLPDGCTDTDLSDSNYIALLSTAGIKSYPVASVVNDDDSLSTVSSPHKVPIRVILLPSDTSSLQLESNQLPTLDSQDPSELLEPTNLLALGILEADNLEDEGQFPVVKGTSELMSAMAVCEMLSLHQNVPFRRDTVQKILKDQFRRGKDISIELFGGICEILGMSCMLAETQAKYLSSAEAPAVFIKDGKPYIYYGVKDQNLILATPSIGLLYPSVEDFFEDQDINVRFCLPKRVDSTPTSRFGWSWFIPLLKKYKKALILVFIASMLAKLFGLAIPLLLQQIIDKVLSQGNLSSLNVLGTAMVVMALFQGILTALRTYIFVDTTDRMDLTLGSAVIDRLLALPLNYFEKRPVGELSQRLGELNTIRSFLTGTALISVLNLVFAVLYLVVMFIYSPLLSVVALSTFPLYALLVFGVAPIYKSLIRKKAVAQARTQSHLIEVIGGIQTVKAQHFELTARWKWQDRYRRFVTEGFKSVALGSTAGEIGNFLNTLSGLCVLWVGMWLVLKGEFSLGQLIAFRIISGNVTGPLLQLAGLYQGFQGVQLSMERLSDIIDQTPELNKSEELHKISLPPIKGDVRFEDISFRFTDTGPYQLDNVSVSIKASSFVGIVGQSGSGKSTLMKLLPRLYNPAKGRIFIDDYDIAKVDISSLRRQVGIVPQDSLLFEGTVSENIALNDPNATTESIIEAAKIACAHDFIMSLGQGYATPIAEKGSNLSGGQRQRIAIARTIMSNPQLLVMDEATSALDYNTERTLCMNLQRWSKDRTVLFITHRLSTIKNSDQILVMDSGRLVESGTHNELISKKGRYSAL